MSLIYSQTPGLVPQPATALAAGTVLSSLPLSVIQSDTDFANVAVEVFYQELYHGDALTLPASFVDGYLYSASELVLHWERRSTVSSPGGLPAAAGSVLEIADWVDPNSLKATLMTPYMVQGGATSDTNDGILAVWAFGIRGRGLVTIPSGLSFAYQADSAFAQGQPLTQALLQSLSASAQSAAVRCEVFTDAGQGTNWTPGWTPAVNGYGKPSWGHANGCYYQAAEVIGPTGAFEPIWPTQLNSVIVDGGVIWVCVGRGFSNGQQFSMPTSPVDGHVYTSGEMACCLTSWITTGQGNNTGPSGKGRIQRLQKSAPAGLVSTTVTYWDGNNQSVTNDGIVHCVGIFQRALPSYPSTPPAYNIFSGDEFMSGHGLCITEPAQPKNDAQYLAENVNDAAVRPEVFWNTGKITGVAPTLPTSHSGFVYARNECMNVYDLADTGAMPGDYALRLFVTLVDPASGLVTLRTDYYHGSAPVTTPNGSLDIAVVARRDENVLLGGLAVIGLGGSPGIAPAGVDGIANGSFEIWADLLHAGTQLVAVPALWSISNSTQDGYTTQQPGIDSTYGVGLDVGNAHGAANTQWISLLSYPMAILPGAPYAWGILAFANPAISTGFIVRLHLRDLNFANDVSCDLVPDQSLGTSASSFGFKFTMPGSGDTVIHTENDVLSLSGAAPAQLTYAYLEIWNYKPNVTSAVICDDSQMDSLAQVQDAPAASASSAPTLSTVAGGFIAARTYYVQTSYNMVSRMHTLLQTLVSAEATIAVPSGYVLKVTAPPKALNGATWNVFVGTASGAETMQNSGGIASGTDWTEPFTGLAAGVLASDTDQVGGTGTDAVPSGSTFRRIKGVNSTNQATQASLAPGSINNRGYATFSAVALSTASTTLATITLSEMSAGDLLYITYFFSSISSDYGNNFFVNVEIDIDGVGTIELSNFINYVWGADGRSVVFTVTSAPSSGVVTLKAALGNGTSGSAGGTFYVGNQGAL